MKSPGPDWRRRPRPQALHCRPAPRPLRPRLTRQLRRGYRLLQVSRKIECGSFSAGLRLFSAQPHMRSGESGKKNWVIEEFGNWVIENQYFRPSCPLGDNALDSVFKLPIYQITQLPNRLTSLPLSSITSLHLVMGSAVRIRHCPATVFAENLKRQATGKVPISRPDFGVTGKMTREGASSSPEA